LFYFIVISNTPDLLILQFEAASDVLWKLQELSLKEHQIADSQYSTSNINENGGLVILEFLNDVQLQRLSVV
jgi:hypothetical protein